MATLAPEGSSWYRVLQEMGEEWKKVSGGAVSLRIYPGGVAGDEDAMIRKMRVGQIQAAAITGIGLAYLERSFYALHIPMMYASDEEFDYVRDRYAPVLERKLEEKGFIVLNWGDAGWVPLTGATVIEMRAWGKIPAALRPKLLEASRAAGRKLRVEIRRLNREATEVMVKNGLKIHQVPPEVQAQWRKMVEDIHPRIRGKIMPAEAFDAVKKFRDEYRASN